MPLTHLKNLDIRTKEEESLVQEVLNKRVSASPPPVKVDRSDVPFHITNKEEELRWQKILDEREAKIRNIGKPEEEVLVAQVQELEEKKETLEKELQPKFCEFCDSKGRVHKKTCTRPQ